MRLSLGCLLVLSLAIEVAGEKETIPLSGAAPHIPLLEKLCFAKK